MFTVPSIPGTLSEVLANSLTRNTLPETEHFKIVHFHWLAGTRYKQYGICEKPEMTSGSPAALPALASGDSPEMLVEHLHQAEAWYLANRNMVEQSRSAA